jgi:hypothetical protein
MEKLYKKLVILLLIASAVSVYFIFKKYSPTHRAHIILINETKNNAQDAELKSQLRSVEEKSKTENAMILLKELPKNEPIQKTAAELFEKNRIGGNREDRGILYLYSERENLFDIQVSPSLEQKYPESFRRQISDRAKDYMPTEKRYVFLSDLLVIMNSESPVTAFSKSEESAAPDINDPVPTQTVQDLQNDIVKLSAKTIAEFAPSTRPSETVERYLKSVEMGFANANLKLLTQGSQFFRTIHPLSSTDLKKTFENYMQSFPYRMSFEGSFGIIVFREGVPHLPIILRKGRDNLWYVDEAKAGAYFQAEGNSYVAKFDDLPISRAYENTGHSGSKRILYPKRAKTPIPPKYPIDLVSAVNQWETHIRNHPKDISTYIELGEFYLFEMRWLARAIVAFERVRELDPEKLDIRWRLVDLYISTSRFRKAMEELKFLSEKMPADAKIRAQAAALAQSHAGN